MSALANASARSGITDLLKGLLEQCLPYFQKEIWIWYDANADRVLFSKWGLFKIKVSDFEGLIAEIAGPRSAVSG